MKVGLNIYRIERKKNLSSSDVIFRMRRSLPGRFYIKYLKKYKTIRLIVQFAWLKLYPVYLRHSMVITVEHAYPLVKFGFQAKRDPESVCQFYQPERLNFLHPSVYPESENHIIKASNERIIFPEVSVITLQNALISGGTNLILSDNKVYCHDLFNFYTDYTSEELHGRVCIYPKANHIRIRENDTVLDSFPLIASFVDACAANYAHWMTEVLPRINLFCSEDRFRDIPIVVNEGMHQNIMESLYAVVGSERRIITLPIGVSLRANRIFAVTATGYIPFDWRTTKINGHSHGIFSPSSLNSLVKKIKYEINTTTTYFPKKIIIKRNSGTRLVINAVEIENKLVDMGFSVVEPEKLTFGEQVLLFSKADMVVGATGAAFANLLFCKPSAHIVIMMSKHKSMPYLYWQNMACSVGCQVNYVLGNIVSGNSLGIHGNFYVKFNDLVDCIKSIESIR